MNKKKRLSIIIPFLNEKEEVENTIKSILEFSDKDIEIIVINDASDDSYDYAYLEQKYDICYIVNKERIGIAAARNLGVEVCSTPYFLLLDAHMRFYDTKWENTIINILQNNPKYLLCCQTKVLRRDKDETIQVNNSREESFGAAVDLYDEKSLFISKWIFEKEGISENCRNVNIACVLGAGYACCKEYWQYLKGLEGLMYYGYDETYISIKVWLTGGKCILLRDIVIGHIYRDKPPYQTDSVFFTYNRLLINELLASEESKNIFLSKMRFKPYFSEAYGLLYKNRDKIDVLKQYYQTIFTKDFSFFEELNNQSGVFINSSDNEREVLNNLALFLVLRCQSMKDIGLLEGRMGVVIFLLHYARLVKCTVFQELADELLEGVFSTLNVHLSYYFKSGLAGIGWGICYLHHNNFIEGDITEILSDIDNKITEIDITKIQDLNLNGGLGGIVHYIIFRLYTINKTKSIIPFEKIYLQSLHQRLINIILNENEKTDCLDVFVRFILYYEEKIDLSPPSIHDITNLNIPNNFKMEEYALGLIGNAGIGLKLILESGRNKKYKNTTSKKKEKEAENEEELDIIQVDY